MACLAEKEPQEDGVLAAARRLAGDLRAEFLCLRVPGRHRDPARVILRLARRRRVDHLLLGPAGARSWGRTLWDAGESEGTLAVCWELPGSKVNCMGFSLATRPGRR